MKKIILNSDYIRLFDVVDTRTNEHYDSIIVSPENAQYYVEAENNQ